MQRGFTTHRIHPSGVQGTCAQDSQQKNPNRDLFRRAMEEPQGHPQACNSLSPLAELLGGVHHSPRGLHGDNVRGRVSAWVGCGGGGCSEVVVVVGVVVSAGRQKKLNPGRCRRWKSESSGRRLGPECA